MIDVIVFDLGGVIVNVNFGSPLGILFDNSRSQSDIIKDKSKFSILLQDYETGNISAVKFHEKIIDHLGIKLSFDEFKNLSNEAIEAGDDGIDYIIKSLSDSYSLAILSNTNPIHYEHIKEIYPDLNLFDHKLLSYEMGEMKPDIAAYEKLLNATSRLPSQHLFIDDRIENINAAKEIGMDGILYSSISSLTDELRKRGIKI